jgi:stage III sporulation protein SpoIIIAA
MKWKNELLSLIHQMKLLVTVISHILELVIARRMQVAKTELQHQVMIEAVENHIPQVIIIDEIEAF